MLSRDLFFFAWEWKNTWIPYYRPCEYIENVKYNYTTLCKIAVNNNLIFWCNKVLRMSHVFFCTFGRLLDKIIFKAFAVKVKKRLFGKIVIEIFYDQSVELTDIVLPKKSVISCQHVNEKLICHFSLICLQKGSIEAKNIWYMVFPFHIVLIEMTDSNGNRVKKWQKHYKKIRFTRMISLNAMRHYCLFNIWTLAAFVIS